MRTFLNYSARWRNNEVLINTSDAAPLKPGQNMVALVSSVIAKIFNPKQVLDGHISTFLNDTLVLISARYCYLLPVIYCSTFVQCYSFQLFSVSFCVQYLCYSVNIQF
jgi:hypothetical protein